MDLCHPQRHQIRHNRMISIAGNKIKMGKRIYKNYNVSLRSVQIYLARINEPNKTSVYYIFLRINKLIIRTVFGAVRPFDAVFVIFSV